MTLLIGPGAAVPFAMLTRHAGIFGATGTGKTTTAAALIERMAAGGVPCLVLDAKGDLESLGGQIWDITGERGLVRRMDLGKVGPDLFARALELSDAQAGALEIAFQYAALYSLPDLKKTLGALVNNRAAVSAEIGLVTPSSVAAVQRAMLRLQRAAPDAFGQPALDPFEATGRDADGRGRVTVLRAGPLTVTPGLYGAAVAHILETLFNGCGECESKAAPALAVFIDEAHLVFDGAPPVIIRKLESIVRLIRSKGVALFFATQAPGDLPAAISGQLATRIQHGLRGATANQLKEIRAAADSMPAAPGFNAFAAIRGLGTGQALVSVPRANGTPTPAAVVQVAAGTIEPRPLRADQLPISPPPRRPPPDPTIRAPISPPPSRQVAPEPEPKPPNKTLQAWKWGMLAGLVLYGVNHVLS